MFVLNVSEGTNQRRYHQPVVNTPSYFPCASYVQPEACKYETDRWKGRAGSCDDPWGEISVHHRDVEPGPFVDIKAILIGVKKAATAIWS